MSVGGSISEVSIGGRIFAVAADSDSNRDIGGYMAEVEPNGNGTARKILTRKPWVIDGLNLEVDDDRGDIEFLQAIADGPDFVPCIISYVSGISYTGQGSVTNEIQASSQSATVPVTLKGPNELVPQK